MRAGDKDHTISDTEGREIYFYLVQNSYIDIDGHVTDKYRDDLAAKTLVPLPGSCKEITDGVHALIKAIFDEHALDEMIVNGHDTRITENALNDNFYKKEFQALWKLINHKYAYTVEFDSEELIEKAVEALNTKISVSRLQYT